MNENILQEILDKVTIISDYIAAKSKKEQTREDLESPDIATAANACAKIGEESFHR